MTQNTILSSLPYSEQADPLTNYGDRKKAEWAALDARIPGRFSSYAIRNSTYASWTAQGGVMVDGMACTVAGKWFLWRANEWHAVGTEPPVFGPANRTLPLSRGDGVEDSFYAGTVADPGYKYRLWVEANARVYAANCECDIRVRAGNGAVDSALGVVTRAANVYNNLGLDVTTPRRATGVLSGPARVIGYAVRTGGSGDWNITAASVYYQIEPA